MILRRIFATWAPWHPRIHRTDFAEHHWPVTGSGAESNQRSVGTGGFSSCKKRTLATVTSPELIRLRCRRMSTIRWM